MTVSLYSFAGMYSRVLDTASHLLDKGVEFATANGASEADLLNWRLIDDMAPLGFQLAILCNFPRAYMARAIDKPLPDEVSSEMDVAGFRAAIADAKAYLAGLTPEQFEGRDGAMLNVTLGNGFSPTLSIEQWVSIFATTNIYFHMSIAYAILRANGVQIGKVDLFSGGL